MVADGTPYIVSTLEYTPDTLLHVPEVYVGRLRDPQDPDYHALNDRANVEHLLKIWQPTLQAQVLGKVNMLRLIAAPEPAASVHITGPLGTAQEATVAFGYAGHGVYEDRARALVLAPRGRYRLDVRLPEGKAYQSETTLPDVSAQAFPSEYRIAVHRSPDGYGGESSLDSAIPRDSVRLSVPEGAKGLVYNFNRSLEHDRCVYPPEPGRDYAYADRGNWLRGPFPFVGADPERMKSPGFALVWSTSATRCPRFSSVTMFPRVSFVNDDLMRFFEPEHNDTKMWRGDPYWMVQDPRLWRATVERDLTYLPSVSNILQVGPSGNVLPKAQSDAVGVFGGFTTRYYKSRIVPVRDFDPCLLWPGTSPCGVGT